MNIKKDKFKYLPGFTVLELLIVIAMMVLLMGMVLMGLNNSRSHARDQGRISDIKKIQIGITQYYQVCGNYPVTLDANAACTNLSSQGKSLKDFLPDIDSFGFTSGNTGKYKYVPITYVSGGTCSGYHIGVELEESSNALATKDSQSNSATGVIICGSTSGFNGASTNPLIYDIMVNY